MTVEEWAQFNAYHARNREQAAQLRRFIVLCVGVGATGSHVAALLAQAGCRLILIDRDTLDYANLTRHYVTDRASIAEPKSHALAQKLRREVPSLQVIRGIKGDVEQMSDPELAALLGQASLVVGSSGRDAVDHRLNRIARDLHLPLVVPSLWGENDVQVLGDVHVIPWHQRGNRRGACFECLRRPTAEAPAPAEAQPGAAAEVIRVASLTAEIVLALLLSDSPQFRALMRNLNRAACYYVLPRWPPTSRAVITRARRDCAACSTARVVQRPVPTWDPGPLHEWLIGAGLTSTVFWHQLVPGLDFVTTLAFIGLAGLWWRDRLPSYPEAIRAIRNWWAGH